MLRDQPGDGGAAEVFLATYRGGGKATDGGETGKGEGAENLGVAGVVGEGEEEAGDGGEGEGGV